MASSTLPNMETPTAFNRSIRFSVPTHQRSTFDRAIACLLPDFLGFPTTGKVFKSPAACKVRLQGFLLGQGFTIAVGKSNKDAFVEFPCTHHSTVTQGVTQEVIDCRIRQYYSYIYSLYNPNGLAQPSVDL
jgi:hypothetical protein